MADLGKGVPSPCNQVCVLDAHEVCIGCGRTSDEIGCWSRASIDEQLDIVSRAHRRLQELQAMNSPNKD